MIKGVTWTRIQSVWNYSGPSEVPYSEKWSGTFFAISYSKLALVQLGTKLSGSGSQRLSLLSKLHESFFFTS